ncbi:kinesin-related protein 4-like [Saccostrea cucullata]|uniref:kinesin-related protein 4-like n=1 Tax=Saccostrea cuccullata TaxID=36930 RepID=UPI002ED48DDD
MALKNKERLKCLESLGLEEDATEDEIKRAYKNLALKHHPDKNPDNADATKVFQEISESYYLLTTKYAKDKRRKIHVCKSCGNIHYMDSDDEDFYDDYDDQYFENDDDDDDYYDNLPCDDDEESVLWFFGRLFYDVFADFVFERRFQSSKKKSSKWTADEKEEDSFFDSIFKKYRPPQDVELTEEDLKKFHSYDEWLKARHPSKRHNHRMRKGKKKANQNLLQKPRPKSKKQLLAEQKRREQEMREIGQTLLPKMEEKQMKKSTENIPLLVKLTTDDHSEEVENQHKKNFQRKQQEEEKLQLLEAQERQKNKRQQRKDMKEKKKQLRQEAEKVLQEKKFSNPAPKRKKTELELHEEKQTSLFGNKDINKENVLVDTRRAEEHETKSSILGKHFSDIGNLCATSNNTVNITQNSQSNNANTLDPFPDKTKKNDLENPSAKPKISNQQGVVTNQPKQTVRPAGKNQPKDTEVKSSLLQRHLQEFNDLLKVQPQRHTEQQLKVERARQREEQQLIQQRELDSLRSRHTEQFVPPSLTDVGKESTGMDISVQEEFERMRKEHIRKQQELERKRNEEEVQELKTYRKRQKWKELPVESTQKWFERDIVNRVPPPKVQDPPAPSINVWQQRNLRQQQVTSLRPRTTQEEEEILKQVLLLSEKTAAQEEEQRRYREIMAVKNFIPEQLQKGLESPSLTEVNSFIDDRGKKKMSSNSDQVSTTKGQRTTEVKKNQEVPVTKLDKQASNQGVKGSATIVTTKDPRPTDLQKNQGVQPSTKLTKPVANDSSGKNFTSGSATKNQMTTGIQNNNEVKTSTEPSKPVAKAGPISFAKAVTTKMQNSKKEVENIWESVPNKKPKSSFLSGDRPKLYTEEEAPERPVLTTNYANLIPPPRVHISPQKTEKESWDDDGQYLYVSSKLPTTARECYRWQTSAKVVMSANENRNNSAHPSALEQESKTLPCKENSSIEKKNDVKLNQTDLKRNRPDMPRYVPGSGSLKPSGKKDVNGNIKEEKDQPALAESTQLEKEESTQKARNPWSNKAIDHQSGDPRPNAEWSESKQFPLKAIKSTSSDRIPAPLQNPILGKAFLSQNLKEPILSQISAKAMAPLQNNLQGSNLQGNSQKMEESTGQRAGAMTAPLTAGGACTLSHVKVKEELGPSLPATLTVNYQNIDDYWNVSNITRKTEQIKKEAEVKKSPDSLSSLHGTQDKSSIQSRETTKPLNQSEEKTESLIASLQRKAYQMTTSSRGSSGAVRDDWAIPTKQPIKTEKPNSPSEFFISPEKVVSEQTSAAVGAASHYTVPPVLPFVQNKEKQTTAMSDKIVPKQESWEDEISAPIISKEAKNSNLPKTEKIKVQTVQDGAESDEKVLQLPPKKMSSMFNKMAKFGISPNPIKKEKTSESSPTSLPTSDAEGSQEPKPERPGYRQRPMKLVSKPSKTFADTVKTEDKAEESPQAKKTEVEELDSLGLNFDKMSLVDNTLSSPTQEMSQSLKDNGVVSSDSRPPVVNVQDSVAPKRQKPQDASLAQTTSSKDKEDWESELITLPTKSGPPTRSNAAAENFFKEKMRTVKKDSFEHRLPVLKSLTKHEEDLKNYQTSEPQASASNDQNEERSVNGDQFKERITSEQHSTQTTFPTPAVKTTHQELPTSIFNHVSSTFASSETSKSVQSYSIQSGPTGTTSNHRNIDHVSPEPVNSVIDLTNTPERNMASMKTEPFIDLTYTPEKSQDTFPPGLHLPTAENSNTIQQPSGVASADPMGIPNLGLPLSMPPHLVQAYMQYLATAGGALGGGIGMLPNLPLLPGIAPLLSLGLPNPLLPNPLLPMNFMGLPTQPLVDPSQGVNQPQTHAGMSESQPQSHNNQPQPVQPQSHDQPQLENQPKPNSQPQPEIWPQSHGQPQSEIQLQSHGQPQPENHDNYGKPFQTSANPQTTNQGLFHTQSGSQFQHSKSMSTREHMHNLGLPQPNNSMADENKPQGLNAAQMRNTTKPTTECWDSDEAPVTKKSFRMPCIDSQRQDAFSMRQQSSKEDNQKGIPTKHHDEPVSAKMGQFTHSYSKPVSTDGEENRWHGGKSLPFRSVFDEKPPVTKLPESLVKRKEQTRTVQALIQHVLKENQEGKKADLLSCNMDRN